MAHSSARGLVLAALAEWRRGRRFADAILRHRLEDNSLSAANRAFATELFYGTLCNLSLLDFWIGLLRSGPLDRSARDLLRIGLYQLFCLHTPGHAAVNETVELAPPRKRPLINGVLRTALRRAEELASAAQRASLAIRSSHPEFLLERWAHNFGRAATVALCDWNNQPASVYARINRLNTTVEKFLEAESGATAVSGRPNFVKLEAIPAGALERGDCYIQDPSTSIACELLDPQPGEDVLDACAAPGGKSGLLAELMNNRGHLIACDRDSARLVALRENLNQLRVTIARTILHDWHSPATPGMGAFDRILVDAPCSNTGVMRRRVDVRWRLTPEDFRRMPAEQVTILRAVAPLLRPGGTLVYSTCSLEPEENEQVVDRILAEIPSLGIEDIRSSLPFRDGFDGAFAAKLRRSS